MHVADFLSDYWQSSPQHVRASINQSETEGNE